MSAQIVVNATLDYPKNKLSGRMRSVKGRCSPFYRPRHAGSGAERPRLLPDADDPQDRLLRILHRAVAGGTAGDHRSHGALSRGGEGFFHRHFQLVTFCNRFIFNCTICSDILRFLQFYNYFSNKKLRNLSF
jgi:hypothetical protein